jgi:hypothetical protein
MAVTSPVNASMPLPSAPDAALALPALIERVRTLRSSSSHRKSPTLSASAGMTYTAGIKQRLSDRRRRPAPTGLAWCLFHRTRTRLTGPRHQ